MIDPSTRWRLTVTDPLGRQHAGSVVIAARWEEGLGRPAEGEAFRLLLLLEPLPDDVLLEGPVAVCTPPARVASARLREPGPAYAGPGLSPEMTALLARGRIHASVPLELSPRELFRGSHAPLEVLAQRLVLQWERWHYLRAVAHALHAPGPADTSSAVAVKAEAVTLWQRARDLLPADAPLELTEALARTEHWLTATDLAGELRALREGYPDAAALAREVFLLRALAERTQEALELARLRQFLRDAVSGDEELELDRALALEQLSYAVLLLEPQRLTSGRLAFEAFQERYRALYEARHRAYWGEAVRLRQRLLGLARQAQALQRLNTLSELGPPLGTAALSRYRELLRRLEPCPQREPLPQGALAPRCPACGVESTAVPPHDEVEEVAAQLERALGRQMARLARAIARQVLAQNVHPSLEQLLRIVQASQIASLAEVLDDELLGHLRRFLVEARLRELLDPLLMRLQRGHALERAALEQALAEVASVLERAARAIEER